MELKIVVVFAPEFQQWPKIETETEALTSIDVFRVQSQKKKNGKKKRNQRAPAPLNRWRSWITNSANSIAASDAAAAAGNFETRVQVERFFLFLYLFLFRFRRLESPCVSVLCVVVSQTVQCKGKRGLTSCGRCGCDAMQWSPTKWIAIVVENE